LMFKKTEQSKVKYVM